MKTKSTKPTRIEPTSRAKSVSAPKVTAPVTSASDSDEISAEDSYEKAFLKAFKRSIKRNNSSAVDLFGHLCDHHRGRFSLNRATLLIVNGKDDHLSSFALWDNGQMRSGVMVQIPRERSAFYELLETRCCKTFSPGACFNGSMIEEKLTIGNSSGALFLAPLYNGNTPVGLIAFNSNERRPFAETLESLRLAIDDFGAGFSEKSFLALKN